MRKSKGKERVRVSVVERRRREKKEEASGIIRSLEASFYTKKGRDISEIFILPLSLITGYYILPSL